MKKFVLIILFIFYLPFVIADDWFYNSEELVINLEISSKARLIPTSSNYNIKYLSLNLSFYPFDDENQKVINLAIEPSAKLSNKVIQFQWHAPQERELSFNINADVKTFNRYIPVKSKVEFPIKKIPEELREYTLPSKTIDSDNEEIIKSANELAAGEDDLFSVVYKLAEWTNSNIKYDLSTLTAEISQKASWVLSNKQGVCDELTSLFIAMARSLGIPAKFIAGIAYTESELFPEKWGAHGWAEIYFPGYGWIPFDVTYGQYGYVDPTHIKLKESIDGTEPSSEYEWLSTNIALETGKLDIKANMKEKIGSIKPHINIDIETLKPHIGFGSYNLVIATLKNLAGHYTTTSLQLATPKEVETIDKNLKSVMLKPFETKKLFWIIKLSDELERDYIYTMPVAVVTQNNFTSQTSFTSIINERVYLLNEIHHSLNAEIEEERKAYSRNVELACTTENKEFYEDEIAMIRCNISNTGNVYLGDLSICMDELCENFDLGISKTTNKSIKISGYKNGKYDIAITVKNNAVSKTAYNQFNVLDKPSIVIENLVYSNNVSFDEEFAISFLLKKLSLSSPKNVNVKLIQDSVSKEFSIEQLSNDKEFVLNIAPRSLTKKINEFQITVTYEDKLGRGYAVTDMFIVRLKNITLLQKVIMLINRIGVKFIYKLYE